MSKSVLVTGGCGYIGSVLCHELVNKKSQNGWPEYEVTCYDSCLYGDSSISDLYPQKNFHIIKADIRDLVSVSKALKNVDSVIHLAGIVGAPAVKLDPDMAIETNRLATQALGELCTLHGTIENFIFASSCSVYGDTEGKLATEKTPTNPLEIYAESKLNSERDLQVSFPTSTILRFGTLMGLSPRMRFDLVVNKFIAQACNNEPIVVEGGEQKRPFLHMKDCVDAIILALETPSMDGIYNVISDNYSIRGMAHIIETLSGAKIQYSKDITDMRNYEASIDKINRFGFKPKRDFGYTFNEIARWFDKNQVNWKDVKYSNYDSLMFKKAFG